MLDAELIRRELTDEPWSVLGQSGGSHALHYLLEDPFAGDELSDAFLYAMMNELSFANGPLYALLHEAAYAQGLATRWSAQQAWVTSEYEHDGLRVSNGAVLDRLIGMARGNI